MARTWFQRLALTGAVLAFGVVTLGAYVRLSDAGLGCPDWPGCYGHLDVPAGHEIAAANAAYPERPVEAGKAWREMVHRYLAGILGLLIFALAMIAWRRRREPDQPVVLPLFLLALVIFQALLGMWTVTLLLKPMVVTAHLLGGMATLSLLLWLWLRERDQFGHAYYARADHLHRGALFGLVLVVVQIALGGWVSTNYAALACTDFPLCQGVWVPEMDFEHSFTLHRELGETASGDFLPMQALTAIHWVHRLMALVVFVTLAWLVTRLFRTPGYKGMGLLIGVLLLIQFSLGVSNVLFSLPIAVAVAHNAGAALLLGSLVLLNFRIRRR